MVHRAITNIRNMLLEKQTEIMSVAGMLMVISLITKVFGLLFNSVAAGYLGTQAYDTFIFASNLPELISNVILLGGISASVLPILSNILDKKGEYRFLRVFNSLINISVILFAVIALIVALLAPNILPWFIREIIRPATEITIEQKNEMVNMLRILMIPQIILGISTYLTTSLNLHERFLVPQLAPLFYNLGRIVAIYMFIPILGKSPWVLVIGTIIGAIIHLVIQIPVVRHIGIKYIPIIDMKDYFINKIGQVAVPRIMSISIEQVAITIDKFIAYGLAGPSETTTALAIYNLAILVVSMPLTLFGNSFAIASFPTLSKAFNKNDRILASQVFIKIMNQILFFSVPAAVLLLVLRVPVTRLTFGIFGSEIKFTETYSIAWTILFFAPGLIFESLRTFLYRTFYATHDTIRPLIISLFTMVIGALSGILFTQYLSHFDTFALNELELDFKYFLYKEDGVSAVGGLALSSSLVFSLEAIIMIIWLNKKYLQTTLSSIWKPVLKKLLAGTIMFAATYLIFKIWADHKTTQKTLYLIILTCATSAASAMTYLGVSWVLRIEEVKVYINFLARYPNIGRIKRSIRKFLKFDPIPEDIDY